MHWKQHAHIINSHTNAVHVSAMRGKEWKQKHTLRRQISNPTHKHIYSAHIETSTVYNGKDGNCRIVMLTVHTLSLSLTLSVCFSFILLWLIAVALLYSAIFKRFVQQLFSSVKFCCLTNQINIFLIINWILFNFFAKRKISSKEQF